MFELASSGALPTKDALTTLLTVESLLFAALSICVALGQPTEFGRRLPTSPLAFSLTAAGAVTLIAFGAATAWINAYLDPCPATAEEWIEGIALGAGIVAQAVFAWWVALAMRDI